MNHARFGAVRRLLLTSAVLASFAVDATAQVVEKGRTFADLTASHPCNSGLTERIARVTDCDAADDVGDGEGAFQCWVRCDGSAPWETVAIGGGAGGGAATAVQGDATLPATCTEKDLYQDTNSGGTEFYVCTATNTWTKAGTGDGTIGGTLTATDDLLVCTDGTGGSTIGACTVGNIDNLRLDGNTLSSTDTDGNINIAPNGSGLLDVNAGSGLTVRSAGARWVNFDSVGVNLADASAVAWSNTAASYQTKDTGIARLSAGVVKSTDGSTGIRGFLGGGAAIASATALPVPNGRGFHVTGTTAITSITATNLQAGVVVTLVFDDALTFTDGNNLKIAGNFVTTADDTISLYFDGTNFYEQGRSVN